MTAPALRRVVVGLLAANAALVIVLAGLLIFDVGDGDDGAGPLVAGVVGAETTPAADTAATASSDGDGTSSTEPTTDSTGEPSDPSTAPTDATTSSDEPADSSTTASADAAPAEEPAAPPPTMAAPGGPTAAERTLDLAGTIGGDISPKSVVHSGAGKFVAQNMMYRHTITLYDRSATLVATIPDTVDLHAFGMADSPGEWQGSPVEAAFTSDGKYAYISNYEMYGPGYGNPGGDSCADTGAWDESFVYRVAIDSATIDQLIPVGSVPKYVAVTPDDSRVLVTNWCSYDLSIIDTERGVSLGRLDIGRFPRGIAVTSDSSTAYIAVMGSSNIAVVDLETLALDWIYGVGANPRHVVLSPDDRYLYVTLNGEGRLAKIDTQSRQVVAGVATGQAPRSMAISDDGTALYVVNYKSNTMSKVRTEDFVELQELPTGHHPIGITYDPGARQVWVANYSGSIQVFDDVAPG